MFCYCFLFSGSTHDSLKLDVKQKKKTASDAHHTNVAADGDSSPNQSEQNVKISKKKPITMAGKRSKFD